MAVSVQLTAAVSCRYLEDVNFDEKKSVGRSIAEYNDSSLSFCSAMCDVTCGCFGFNLKEKKCQIHHSFDQSNITVAEAGWKHFFPEAPQMDKDGRTFPLDCRDIFVNGQTRSGVYQMYPFKNDKSRVVNVSCNMENCGRWWTVIQKRRGGSVNFNRFWDEYKNGFGNLEDSFWIGNEVIHQLTKGRNSSLYVSITLRDGRMLYEYYDQFSVSDEADNYRLFLGGPAAGTLGDSMSGHSGMYFSTPDRDQDIYSSNCAANYNGGWWFKACQKSFLNDPWSPGFWLNPWKPTIKKGKDIIETLMMIKPH
ncbi:fibrinogen-like protein A [Saccostrea echinata]|uniref:fibrinogen-like protein A n=1 Tax=Saccostrea echinata TaxID=191078 RepID=UPI002A7F681A|nr:fibrinogen-like protein A [Saccostrea echinata]